MRNIRTGQIWERTNGLQVRVLATDGRSDSPVIVMDLDSKSIEFARKDGSIIGEYMEHPMDLKRLLQESPLAYAASVLQCAP